MTAIRVMGRRALVEDEINPGDTMLLGESFFDLATVGAETLPAAGMLAGTIYRTGSTGAYTDTFDTAVNILAAMGGDNLGPPILPGHSLKFRIVNSVAFAETLTLGAGIAAGDGVVNTIAASTWRDFLLVCRSPQSPITLVANTTNGSNVITWVLRAGQFALPEGASSLSGNVNIQVGAAVSGTGIAAGARVRGVTQGVGGTIGITLTSNATADGTNISVTIGPSFILNSGGSGTL